MRLTHALLVFLLAVSSVSAAVSMPADGEVGLPAVADGPAKPALDAFRAGRHAEGVELAVPLAAEGNPDALFLLGFAHETGQGAAAARDQALDFYRRAGEAGHGDAPFRLALLLLASEDEGERAQARETLEAAAANEPQAAGRILGEAYLLGRLSAEPDPALAATWWKRSADAGDAPSLLLLARLREGQFGFPEQVDLPAAMEAYTRAAEQGDPGAMAAVGSRLLNGDPSIRDEEKGREWLRQAIAADEHSAHLALGDFEENVNGDLQAALAHYERGKDAGQIDCTLRAAEFYLVGRGVEQDIGRGVRLLEGAASAGSPQAHFRLAVHRLTGDEPDLANGYRNLLSAATGGIVEAQHEMGLLYLGGAIGTADPVAGVAWLTRAAQSGHPAAQFNLGALYERGAGVPQNFANAGQLYSLATNQGHPSAPLGLARLYRLGLGTEPDAPKAWALAKLAAERGDAQAPEFASELEAGFDDNQRVAADRELEALMREAEAQTAPQTEPAVEVSAEDGDSVEDSDPAEDGE